MSTLFCSRPHYASIDFGTSRFVVGKAIGLNVDGKHLQMGDEIPPGSLNAESLRMAYEPPLSLIELLEYAVTEPALREACARRGVLGPGGVSLGPAEVNLQPKASEAPSEPPIPGIRALRPPLRGKRR